MKFRRLVTANPLDRKVEERLVRASREIEAALELISSQEGDPGTSKHRRLARMRAGLGAALGALAGVRPLGADEAPAAGLSGDGVK